MKSVLLYVLLVWFVFGVPVQAQETDASNRNDGFGGVFGEHMERREDMLEKRDGVREDFERQRERLASSSPLRRMHFSERVKEIVVRRAEYVVSLLDAMIVRLHRLAERIQNRIDLLDSRNIDTAEAQSLLDAALTHITEAETSSQNVQDALESALESQTPREILPNVRLLVDSAKQTLREAHAALVKVITKLPHTVL